MRIYPIAPTIRPGTLSGTTSYPGNNPEVGWDQCDDELRYQDQQPVCYDEVAIYVSFVIS